MWAQIDFARFAVTVPGATVVEPVLAFRAGVDFWRVVDVLLLECLHHRRAAAALVMVRLGDAAQRAEFGQGVVRIIDLMLVRADSGVAAELIRDPVWHELYRDDVAALLKRKR